MQYETQNKTEPFLSDTEAKFTDLDESFETKLDQASRERTLKEKLVEWKNRLFRPITSGYKCETIDYLSLVNKCFGPKIMTFTSLANLLSNFGSVIVYQQISNFPLI